MENLVLFVHLIVALAIIGLILLQRGKGAEMGASFGAGASQTLFGSGGSGNFFSKLTGWLAVVFFVTSFALAVIAKESTSIDDDLPLPALEVESEIPAVEDSRGDVPEVDDIPEAAAEAVEQDIPEVPAE